MLPTGTKLDFYAPPPSHRAQAKQRLNHQREDMFSWRADAHATSFHPVTGKRVRGTGGLPSGPRQVLLPGSQRAADAAADARRAAGSTWASADASSVVAPDSRREWRMTGFVFDKSHFSSRRKDEQQQQQQQAREGRVRNLSGRVRNPYEPFFHDSIVICEPRRPADPARRAGGRGGRTALPGPVTAFAVTCHRAEAEAAAQGSNQAQRSGSSGKPLMGAALASRQRAVELAENMYDGLVTRQALMTGTAVGSPESLDIHLPTSELAYTLRTSYTDKQASKQASAVQRQKNAPPAAGSRRGRGGGGGDGAPGTRLASHVQRGSANSVAMTAAPSALPAQRPSLPEQPQTVPLTPDFIEDRHEDTDDRSCSGYNRSTATAAGEQPHHFPAQHRPQGSGEDDVDESRAQRLSEGDGSVYPPYVSDGYSSSIREPVGRDAHESGAGGRSSEQQPTASADQPLWAASAPNREAELHDSDGWGEEGDGEVLTGAPLPAEAKSTRLYAITLRRDVADQDLSMVRRQEPMRRGVPVVLPDLWRSPMSH